MLESQSVLTDKQKRYFDALYKTLDVSDDDSKIPLQKIVGLLEASGLDKTQLKKIWQLSFRENKLNKEELFTALEYVTLAQNNKELTIKNLTLVRTELPLPRFKINDINIEDYENEIANEKSELTPAESLNLLKKNVTMYEAYAKKQMQSEFVKKLNSSNARKFYASFDLHHSILADIWNLCDINGKGYLDEGEVVLTLHFIDLYLKHIPPPFSLNTLFIQFTKDYLKDLEQRKSTKKDYKGISSENLGSNISLQEIEKVNGSKSSLNKISNVSQSQTDEEDLIYLKKLISIVEDNTKKIIHTNTSFNELFKSKQKRKQLLLSSIKDIISKAVIDLNKLKDVENKIKGLCEGISDKVDRLESPITELPAEATFNELIKRVDTLLSKDFEDVMREIKLGDVPTVSEMDSKKSLEEGLKRDEIGPILEGAEASNDKTENEIADMLEQPKTNANIDPFAEALENKEPTMAFDFGNNNDFDDFGDSANKISKAFIDANEEVMFDADFNF